MAPPPLSTTSASRRFSSSFITGAISTAASPLQASFNLTCRSPIRPSYGAEVRRSTETGGASARHGNDYSPEPASSFLLNVRASNSTEGWDRRDIHYDEDAKSISSEDSPTDQTWFLQPESPGFQHGGYGGFGREEGKLGVVSAINIIVGKTIGVGAYTIPSIIFAGVGSVGMTLLLWVIGSLISFCGLAVYLDLGTAMPRSGGERVYLERMFRKPYMLATCMFMAYAVLLGFSTPNAIVLGEYVLYALDIEASRWNVRVVAVATVTGLCYVHAKHPKLGLRLINVFGVMKMLMLAIVVLCGVAGGLMGIGADKAVLSARRMDPSFTYASPQSTAQRNFSNIWAGSSTQPYDYATALLKIIYCFRGYNTANQVLSDVKNPVRTLKVAAPVALTLISLAYLAINIAFFLVVDKDDLRSAGVVTAGIFFRNLFGPGVGTHFLPLFVIVSAAGNIAATSFAQARVNEELAKDGLLPWSGFWTSSPASSPSTPPSPSLTPMTLLPKLQLTPPEADGYRTPAATTAATRTTPPSRGLLLHWLISTLAILLPPPGPIYAFLVDIGGYPVSVLGFALGAGLLHLRRSSSSSGPRHSHWSSPFSAPTAAVVVSAAANCLLLLLPWVPPTGAGSGKKDGGFVWFAYPATALAVLGTGAAWWVWWSRWGRGRGARARSGGAGGAGEDEWR